MLFPYICTIGFLPFLCASAYTAGKKMARRFESVCFLRVLLPSRTKHTGADVPVCPLPCRDAPIQALATVGSLLGVEEALLETMLTQRVVRTRGEVFEKKLEVQDANLTRDAIVKSLYEVGGWDVRVG